MRARYNGLVHIDGNQWSFAMGHFLPAVLWIESEIAHAPKRVAVNVGSVLTRIHQNPSICDITQTSPRLNLRNTNYPLSTPAIRASRPGQLSQLQLFSRMSWGTAYKNVLKVQFLRICREYGMIVNFTASLALL